MVCSFLEIGSQATAFPGSSLVTLLKMKAMEDRMHDRP